MRIVIAGGSRFATEMVKHLLQRGLNKITLVIEDKEEAVKASTELSKIIVINANPSKPEVLNELELEKCDVFISATKEDEANILAALYAREHNVARIYVKTTKEDTKMILNKLGMKSIDIYETASNNAALDIAEPLISELVGLGVGILDIRQKSVSKYPKIIGKKLGDVKDKFFNIIAVYQDNKFWLSPEVVIKNDANIIVIEETEKIKKKMFAELD